MGFAIGIGMDWRLGHSFMAYGLGGQAGTSWSYCFVLFHMVSVLSAMHILVSMRIKRFLNQYTIHYLYYPGQPFDWVFFFFPRFSLGLGTGKHGIPPTWHTIKWLALLGVNWCGGPTFVLNETWNSWRFNLFSMRFLHHW